MLAIASWTKNENEETKRMEKDNRKKEDENVRGNWAKDIWINGKYVRAHNQQGIINIYRYQENSAEKWEKGEKRV